ncbi:MAG: hypothetical protein QNJ49_10565 [Mastigocoleus sp. MO_167.B18]|nr:hypothetical protein [Mastigocoleus sp. MO_167.B18]
MQTTQSPILHPRRSQGTTITNTDATETTNGIAGENILSVLGRQ